MIVPDASGKRLNLTFASADPPDLSDRVNYEENVTRHDRHSQSRTAVFRADLHRLRLRQGPGSAGTMGGDRGPHGVAAAGAECIRDPPTKRHLDRDRVDGGADPDPRL